MSEDIVIRPAADIDLNALVTLENKAFARDRFTGHQIDYLISRAYSTILILEIGCKIGGAAYMLWRRNLNLGRLYNLAVDPEIQGRGLGFKLLNECENEAARRNCDIVSLEVREDNISAIAFYRKNGYAITESMNDYYEDGSTGLKMTKKIPRLTETKLINKIPYYGQTVDFTCGPASLMMAFKYFGGEADYSRALELTLWKEATLVFMTSGLGGCDPFGLALAARRRGFRVRLVLSSDQIPFFSSVRDMAKKDVIKTVHEDLKEKVLALGIPVSYYNFPFVEIAAGIRRGEVPIVLISTYRLTGERSPHWVTITGFDRKHVYFHDPDVASYKDNRKKARNVRVPIDEFRYMRKFGKDLFKSVIFVGPRDNKGQLEINGSTIRR